MSRTISVLARALCLGRWAGFCSYVARAGVSVSGFDWVRLGLGSDVGGGREECREEKGVLGPIGRFVGAVGGLDGCEADAVVALDLGREGS